MTREGCLLGGYPLEWSKALFLKILICCKGDWAQDSRRILSDITDCS